MRKVITYGTYDLIHYGHIKLLERAKALGDYLIVGVTSDDFDKSRGKINVQQSLMERIDNVKKTGLADEIIIEEYEGQKIDDIIHYDIDVFTVGSDWQGKFDYLNEYCEVVYLDRTIGISSSEIRAKDYKIKLGLVGEADFIEKYYKESEFVNGLTITNVFSLNKSLLKDKANELIFNSSYEELLQQVDAVYLASAPSKHYEQIKLALNSGKHVLCESPIALTEKEYNELSNLAIEKKTILFDGIKTNYSTAYNRLLLLLKSDVIGKIVSVDATCTSLREEALNFDGKTGWNSICEWGPIAMLPVFQILGIDYKDCEVFSLFKNQDDEYDLFSKINFYFSNAVATIKVGKGVKSEGELIISGTKGYIIVPAPWWKTDYFEVKYEDSTNNKRYFYQLCGEGIRSELVSFIKLINNIQIVNNIDKDVSLAICKVIEKFNRKQIKTIKTI